MCDLEKEFKKFIPILKNLPSNNHSKSKIKGNKKLFNIFNVRHRVH